jgi:hypothetical protein
MIANGIFIILPLTQDLLMTLLAEPLRSRDAMIDGSVELRSPNSVGNAYHLLFRFWGGHVLRVGAAEVSLKVDGYA